MRLGELMERGKQWFEWLPGWMPICAAIFGGALWVGQYTQGINDRLVALEAQVKQIQEYLRTPHDPNYKSPQKDGESALPPTYQPQ